MPRRISKVLLLLLLAVLGVGLLSAVTSSAYRGINPLICREMAGLFARSPGLLRYDDLDRLGDCVAFYKRMHSVLRRSDAEKAEKAEKAERAQRADRTKR